MVNTNLNEYLDPLINWSGYNLSAMEDFDVICKSDVDFLEILLLYEKEFSVNMLENSKSKEDFTTIKDFIEWASTNPPSNFFFSFKSHNTNIIQGMNKGFGFPEGI